MAQNDIETQEEQGPLATLSPAKRRLIQAHEQIVHQKPDRSDFLHTVMCQVGMPRRSTEARVFERQSGPFSILLEAGKLWNGRTWVEQPLPYGTTPRLVMVHLSSEAIRTRSRTIELGSSIRQFLQALGMQTNGGARGGYTIGKAQRGAKSPCWKINDIGILNPKFTYTLKPLKPNGCAGIKEFLDSFSNPYIPIMREIPVPIRQRGCVAPCTCKFKEPPVRDLYRLPRIVYPYKFNDCLVTVTLSEGFFVIDVSVGICTK